MDKSQRRVILIRDVSCIAIGAVGMLEQTFVGPVSPILVPAFLTLLLGPAGAALLAQRSSSGQNTIGQSSSPPSAEPQPSSPQQ